MPRTAENAAPADVEETAAETPKKTRRKAKARKAPAKRGGARAGAGRKAMDAAERNERLFSCKLTGAQADWLRDFAFSEGKTPSAAIRDIIEVRRKTIIADDSAPRVRRGRPPKTPMKQQRLKAS